MLLDPVRSSNADKEKVAFVISHELAHQWFGNLVTMDFWYKFSNYSQSMVQHIKISMIYYFIKFRDDLWLKEGSI